MELHRLRMWRHSYILDIKKTWHDMQDTRHIGWVNSSKGCRTVAPSNRGQRITKIHAGSKDGWIPNALLLSAKNVKVSGLDYHQDTAVELFKNRFQHYWLPNIPENYVKSAVVAGELSTK